LVPNKALITGHLLNWTLSDRMNRIVIAVGMDYAADIPQALGRLRQVVEENEHVLDDPRPLITFEGFGSNALTLVLRCYLDSPENRLAVTSQLHQSIHERFRAAGISITGRGPKSAGGIKRGVYKSLFTIFGINKARNAKVTNCTLVLSFRLQFFHNRRHFSNQAKERSTTHRLGITVNVCSSFRLATATVAPSIFRTAAAKGCPV